jgi:hypothetical protein
MWTDWSEENARDLQLQKIHQICKIYHAHLIDRNDTKMEYKRIFNFKWKQLHILQMQIENYLTFLWEMNEIEETGNTNFIHVHSVGDNYYKLNR